MRQSMFSLIALGSVLLLSSCATLSKQECLVGNWQTIGYNDGAAGYDSSRLASHTKACAKANVAPDYQAWERGRTIGLRQYCTTSNAYNLGRSGRALNIVCPAAMTNTLQKSNQQGQEYYALSKQLDEDKRLLEKYRIEFDKLQNGEMLDFKNEKEARNRLLFLPAEFRRINRRVDANERQLDLLNRNQSRSFNTP